MERGRKPFRQCDRRKPREVSIIPDSTAGLSDDDLAKKKLDIPISNITLKLVTAEKR